MADGFFSKGNGWSGLVPYDPAKHKPRSNPDGSYSTEIEVTGDSPDGSTWNIPTLWFDADGNPRELPEVAAQTLAQRYEAETGNMFPRFGSVDEAVAAARARSAAGGAMKTPLALFGGQHNQPSAQIRAWLEGQK
jgi:hypothetical protein